MLCFNDPPGLSRIDVRRATGHLISLGNAHQFDRATSILKVPAGILYLEWSLEMASVVDRRAESPL
jgi:hypothetical protein